MASLQDLLIKRIFRNPLSEIGFRVSDDRDGQWDLKSLLLSGNLSVDSITSSNRYKLSLGDDIYYDALESTFYSGVVRYVKQCSVCEKMRNEKISPAAWNIVTLYYACFFCAVELLRVSGTWSIFLTSSEARNINEINISGTKFSSGTYFISIDHDGSYFNVFISKASNSGGGFHQTIWERFNALINIKKSHITDTKDQQIYSALSEGVGPEKGPSNLRNKWNYREPRLFNTSGEMIAKNTLYAKYGREQSWTKSFKRISSENDEVFSLLNIYKTTSLLINNGLRYVLPEKKLKLIDKLSQ
ncbi:MAG: hypothetical protein CMJ19_25015 [Phycisphaeraceae bacterium]|nr:hypothetical protein [Phycisphaeraceae bacterium]|tara:strand:- start:266 stop:1168 length:903 start_codon:yes stop_codon:yes gene_type:complete